MHWNSFDFSFGIGNERKYWWIKNKTHLFIQCWYPCQRTLLIRRFGKLKVFRIIQQFFSIISASKWLGKLLKIISVAQCLCYVSNEQWNITTISIFSLLTDTVSDTVYQCYCIETVHKTFRSLVWIWTYCVSKTIHPIQNKRRKRLVSLQKEKAREKEKSDFFF